MFERIQSPAGPVFHRSSLLHDRGIRHAFSTRIGGVSAEPFHSLNLGNPNGCSIQDDYERIWENYRLLHRAAGCREDERPCRVHQVHGSGIRWVRPGEEFDCSAKADAMISDDPARVISIRVADCVPILIAREDGSRVAAVHAGWRGVVAGIVPMALGELADRRAPTNCIAAIGPCIGFDAFEVGEEVVNQFRQVFGDRAPIRAASAAKGYVDLREAVRLQLLDAGVLAQYIDVSDRCTYRDRQEFYSHRRDNGITGRMAAVIQCSASRHTERAQRVLPIGFDDEQAHQATRPENLKQARRESAQDQFAVAALDLLADVHEQPQRGASHV